MAKYYKKSPLLNKKNEKKQDKISPKKKIALKNAKKIAISLFVFFVVDFMFSIYCLYYELSLNIAGGTCLAFLFAFIFIVFIRRMYAVILDYEDEEANSCLYLYFLRSHNKSKVKIIVLYCVPTVIIAVICLVFAAIFCRIAIAAA